MFGIPAINVANAEYDASAVLGCRINDLRELLSNSRSFQQRVLAAEVFFSDLSSRAPSLDVIEMAGNKIVQQQGVYRMDALAQETGLSNSTFQRRFRQSVGLPPKVYARIVRFESAVQKKASSPHLTWTEVACECGYYDQMHMIHDFEQLSTETPSGLLGHLANVFESGLHPADKTHLVL
jgi:AraC-like DNA-binding protein